MKIPFSRPCIVGRELEYVRAAFEQNQISIDGPFAARCQDWIATRIGAPLVLLTNSCTSALEMAVILAEVGPGDEVIMPAFTFVSCANAVALRGGVPVFVDVQRDELNIEPMEVSSAITPRTKAIIAVHYGGGVCDISCLMDIARERDIVVIEDVAHSFLSTSRGRYAGAIGHLGAFSFDYQKNVVAGEAGALVINDQRFANRAEIIRQKGTDKNALLRGEISQYLWQDLGSSFAPSDITAAVLLAQIERADDITRARQKYWMRYHKTFEQLERAKIVQRPTVPSDVTHNGHLYYLILRTRSERDSFIAEMKEEEITTPFHFIPLDISPAGRRFGRAHGSLAVTHSVAERLVRLPLWYGMEQEQERIIEMALARLEPKTRLGRRSDRDGL